MCGLFQQFPVARKMANGRKKENEMLKKGGDGAYKEPLDTMMSIRKEMLPRRRICRPK
jgi:hypothetical protein